MLIRKEFRVANC